MTQPIQLACIGSEMLEVSAEIDPIDPGAGGGAWACVVTAVAPTDKTTPKTKPDNLRTIGTIRTSFLSSQIILIGQYFVQCLVIAASVKQVFSAVIEKHITACSRNRR